MPPRPRASIISEPRIGSAVVTVVAGSRRPSSGIRTIPAISQQMIPRTAPDPIRAGTRPRSGRATKQAGHEHEPGDQDEPSRPGTGVVVRDDDKVQHGRGGQDGKPSAGADGQPAEPGRCAAAMTPRTERRRPARMPRQQPASISIPMSRRWQGILSGDSPLATGERLGRRLFSLVPAPAPLPLLQRAIPGPLRGPLRQARLHPVAQEPVLCERCIERAPEGGALVPGQRPLRGRPGLHDARRASCRASRRPPSSVASTGRRRRRSSPTTRSSARSPGDEVMAIFVPGLAGQGLSPPGRRGRRRAAARASATAEPTADWLDVGVGICTGEEYVGNVGGGGFKDFTAIGDITNTAARFQARPAVGRSSSARRLIGRSRRPIPSAEPRALQLKGKQAPVESFRFRIG